MPFVPVDVNSLKLDAPQGGLVPVDINKIKLDAPVDSNQFQASVPGRLLHGAMDPVYGIGQAVPHALAYATSLGGLAPNPVSRGYDSSAKMMDKGNSEREQSYQSARTANGQEGFDFARMGGNIASPANLALGLGAGLLPEVSSLGGRMLQGAAVGAGYGASSPVDTTEGSYASQKAMQSGLGAGMGAAAPVAGEVLSRALYPKIGDEARLLMSEGVRVPVGLPKQLQDRLSSVIPTIQNAQKRSMDDLNVAVANRALKPIGEELPEGLSGRSAVKYVKSTLGEAYDKLLPNLTAKPDAQFAQDMNDISQRISSLPAQEQKVYADILSREIQNRAKSGALAGQDLKDAQTGINLELKTFSASPDAYQQKLAMALKDTQDSLRTLVGRSNPQYAGELEKIDSGYANYARLRAAAGMQGAEQGTFTPAQLSNAVRTADKTVGHGGYATGQAPMQDLSDAAKAVLPNKYPDSGTAGRAMMGYLLAGGVGALAHAPISTGVGLGTLGLYSQPGQAMARALMNRPQAFKPIAQGVEQYSNPAALAKFLTRQ